MTSAADEQIRLGARPGRGVPGRTASSPHDADPVPPRPRPSRRTHDGARFRPEIEGLRAVACLLVVIYHVWIGRVSGGVDVFFALTGFLAAGQMLRAGGRGGIDLVGQWSRTLRRLVPPAVVVLLGTVVASLVFLPESRWPQTIREVVGSALFVENWLLAADSVDYYAAQNTASVVQHFWSLSIQGQFAIAFPLLVVGALWVARRSGIGVRPAVGSLLGAVTAASLAYSVWLTATDQKLAYFDSFTRLWEFTLGGLLALALSWIRLPRALGLILGWAGLVGLAACGMVLDVEGGFPGYLALWPVLCAVAVIVAGDTDHRFGTGRVLSSRPMQYLGSISFPLYLWHWPVLLLALVATQREEAGPAFGAAVILTSLLLAAATRHLVEDPLRSLTPGRRPRWAAYRVALAALIPLLVVTLAWQGVTTARAQPSGVVGDANHPGALAREPGYVDRGTPDVAPIPPAVSAYEDWVSYQDDGCAPVAAHEALELCTWVPAPDASARTIVVVGDSHMQQFLPAVAPVARERGWRVLTLIRPGCPFSTTSESNLGEVACITWNQQALAALGEMRPDLVITQATHNVRPGLTETTPPGFVDAWREMERVGVPVLAVRDNPRFSSSPPSCVDTFGRNAAECQVPRAQLYTDVPPVPPTVPATVSVLDLADSLCTPTSCPPEIGNVIVYLDDNHLTATFTASMAPIVGPRITALLGP